ncbi:hypothetical protein T12_1789 [Trichinella patagoniensis]|uniref:Uncharacterized protein n=1 Tax=Trichinella patagoniensis TaxID=990121 RepID=A0A0V0ZXW6_9BILA|nr:hypothetical protein T12_1789 [Trichinella patagoniensis]
MCTVRSGALAGISQSESSFSCVSSGAQLYSEPLQVLLLCLCIHNNVVQRNDIGAPCHTDSATFTCKYLEASSSVLNQRIPTRASKVSSIRRVGCASMRHSHSCICVTPQPQLSILRLSLSSTDSVIAINGWLDVALFQIDLKPSHTRSAYGNFLGACFVRSVATQHIRIKNYPLHHIRNNPQLTFAVLEQRVGTVLSVSSLAYLPFLRSHNLLQANFTASSPTVRASKCPSAVSTFCPTSAASQLNSSTDCPSRCHSRWKRATVFTLDFLSPKAWSSISWNSLKRMKSSNVYRNHVSGMNVGGGVEIPLLSAVPLQTPL